MAIYAIGDLHLSLGSAKPMDVFGGGWENYVSKISEGFAELKDDDVCVLCGDLSWAMSLNDAREDFLFIHALPGKKVIIKGNHDYWWTTASKIYGFFAREGIDNIKILHNGCIICGDTALCGTRGWFYEEEKGDGHDKKIMLREVGRLETSLKAAGDRDKLVFLHYPPKFGRYECAPVIEMLDKYAVRRCFYGHIHGPGHKSAFEGQYNGTVYTMVSADYLNFRPFKILD